MGVKISEMLPSLVGIAAKVSTDINIQALRQRQIDSIVKAASAPYISKDSLNAALLFQQSWVLSPNPADDEVTVLFNFSSPQNAMLQVLSTTGAIIQTQRRENV